jgi:hypothetical protein
MIPIERLKELAILRGFPNTDEVKDMAQEIIDKREQLRWHDAKMEKPIERSTDYLCVIQLDLIHDCYRDVVYFSADGHWEFYGEITDVMDNALLLYWMPLPPIPE